MSLLSWLAGVAGGMFLAGEAMQGLIILTQPSYVPQPWQGYLFVVMIASVGLAVNSVLARHLPKLEGVVFVMFTIFFIVILAVLWVLSPRLTASEVFQTFDKGGGWPTLGISMLAGQSNLMFVIIGKQYYVQHLKLRSALTRLKALTQRRTWLKRPDMPRRSSRRP